MSSGHIQSAKMASTPWPTAAEFNQAVQNLRTSMADDELREGMAQLNARGLPMPYAGNFADVYQVHCQSTGHTWAVKFFKHPVAGLRERYREISRCLEGAQLPFMVEFRYLEEGVRVAGAWFPIVKMRWIEGQNLNRFVAQSLDQPRRLDQLFNLWVKLAARLREAGIAHADLQHGNVVLVPKDERGRLSLRLIDYDGMYVPALAGRPSVEAGHPSYQHPQRLKEGTCSAELDRFSHLTICCALRCLRLGGRPLWERFDDGENLLFTERDFANPAESALFRELWTLREPDARALAGHLLLATGRPLEQTPLLDDLVQNGRVRLLSASETDEAAELLRGRAPAPSVPLRIAAPGTGPGPTDPSLAPSPSAAPAAAIPAVQAPTSFEIVDAALTGPSGETAARSWRQILATLPAVAGGQMVRVDRMLGSLAGDGNTILHRFLRVVFVLVVFAAVPWMCAAGISYVNQRRALAERKHARDEVDSTKSAARVARVSADAAASRARAAKSAADEALKTLRIPESYAAAELRLKQASAALVDERFADAEQLFDEAVDRLTQARETLEADLQTVTTLVSQLETAFLDDDATAAAERFAGIEELIPREPLLASWRNKLDKMRRKPVPNAALEELTNSIGMKFKRIPAGEFGMGQSDGDADERPMHRVRISGDFYLGIHEVTQDVYQAVTGKSPSYRKGGDFPVERVSAVDADEFCRLLTDQERTPGRLPDGIVYRLPTEAEWEYAARAGTTTKWSFGDDATGLDAYAWHFLNSGGKTHPVGTKEPNAWGLFDTHGNVSEWCLDWYGVYGDVPLSDPIGAKAGNERVLRGAAYSNLPSDVRSAKRGHNGPTNRSNYLGFRVARTYPLTPTTPNATANGERIRLRVAEPTSASAGAPKSIADGEELTNSIGMKLKRIAAGEFEMGQNDGYPNERPAHHVRISRDFYLGIYEVTQSEYRAVTGNSPGKFMGDDLPVENVSAVEADEFCRSLTELESSNGKLPSGAIYRLPTEAEWEYAARAGTTTKWSFGDDEKQLGKYAWYKGNAGGRTHPVGQKLPNAWRLFDMHGNVWEWCSDSYGKYDASAVSDPAETRSGKQRVLRGAAFNDIATYVRSASRTTLAPTTGDDFIGFRVARTYP